MNARHASLVFLAAVSLSALAPARGAEVEGPDRAYTISLPGGEWFLREVPSPFLAWSPLDEQAQDRMIVFLGKGDPANSEPPAEQLKAMILGWPGEFADARDFAIAAMAPGELLRFVFDRGEKTLAAYALAFTDDGKLHWAMVCAQQGDALAGTLAMQILRSVERLAGKEPAGGMAREIDPLAALFAQSPSATTAAPAQVPTPLAAQPLFPSSAPISSNFAVPAAAPTAIPTAIASADGRGLDDPIDPAVQETIKKVAYQWYNAPPVAPHVEQPGWPIVFGFDWTYQYPPTWKLKGSNPHLIWVCDPRELAHFAFIQVQKTPGYHSLDDLGAMLAQQCSEGRPYKVLHTEQKNNLPGLGFTDDTGWTKLWILRALHPQAQKVIAYLSVTILARGTLFPEAIYQWSLSSCPESEVVQTTDDTFAKIILSARFAKPNESDDDDDDGVPNNEDPAPNDPNIP